MTESPNIAALAAPLADPVRARMVRLMMQGRARTLTELGATTGLAKASASGQISTLVDAGFLRADRQGRHNYLTLASPARMEARDWLRRRDGTRALTLTPKGRIGFAQDCPTV